MARVEALTPRPLQCYRCLEPGHTRARCTTPLDRGNRCYRCDQPGHTARGCMEKPKCPLCSDIGRPSGHRLGSAACAPPQKRRGPLGNQLSLQETVKPRGNRQEEVVPDVAGTPWIEQEMSSSPKPTDVLCERRNWEWRGDMRT